MINIFHLYLAPGNVNLFLFYIYFLGLKGIFIKLSNDNSTNLSLFTQQVQICNELEEFSQVLCQISIRCIQFS
jgi:hypothetical protein